MEYPIALVRPPALSETRAVAEWSVLTWTEYGRRIDRIAGGLSTLGVGAGDTVAIMLRNHPQALLADVAALHLGATPFSICSASPPELIRHVLRDAASRVVITELAFLPPLLAARDAAVEHVVVVDGVVAGLRTFDELEALGAGFDARAAARHISDGPRNLESTAND
jgi:long-chain acyl-CoA synthetase